MQSGGYLESEQNINIGEGGDSGTLTVASDGTTEAASYIRIGITNTINNVAVGGTGFVNVEAGGKLLADGSGIGTGGTAAIGVGFGTGSTGSLTVSGVGALVDTSGYYITDGSTGGTGSITVSQGASVEAGVTNFIYAATNIGNSGGTGSLTVTDADSTYTAVGQLAVGSSGTGNLLVENGGSVASGNSSLALGYGFSVGWASGGSGTVTVTGAGSNIFNVGHFIVGGSDNANMQAGGPGTMTIEDGGLVKTSLPSGSYTTVAADIAADAGTGGSSVTVTGTNSLWEISGDLHVGDAAAGALTLAAGGRVIADSLDVGVQSGSSGTVSLTGTSTLGISGQITIGETGTGSLSLATDAVVTATNVAIGATGSVSLAGGLLDPTVFSNAGAISGYGILDGSVDNTGIITATAGTEEITGAVTDTGSLVIGIDGDLQLDGAVASTQSVAFTTADGTLTLYDTPGFAATITQFQQGDVIQVAGVTSSVLDDDVLELFQNGTAFGTLDFAGPPNGITLDPTADSVPCFLAGTLIATDRGERPVEQLAIGDRVLTATGHARPIKWLGYRSYRQPFVANSADVTPVRITAGALADGIPRRDLLVSPLHAMFIDDVLIPASCLVNEASIRRCPEISDIDYIHVELDSHDIILADGAPTESFVDCDSRLMFHNAREFTRRYPADATPRWAFCAPRVSQGLVLRQIRERLAERAGLPRPGRAQGGPLLGNLEIVTHGRIAGWAWQPEHPDSPVVLDVLRGEGIIARLVANAPRPDVREAGHGDGTCGFELLLDHPLAATERHTIHVRRAVDQAALYNSPAVIPSIEPPSEAQLGIMLTASSAQVLDGTITRLRAARLQRSTEPTGRPRGAGDRCGIARAWPRCRRECHPQSYPRVATPWLRR